MIRSFGFTICKKNLLEYEQTYLDNALLELQTKGYEIRDINRKTIERYEQSESFESVQYMIMADSGRRITDTGSYVNEKYFGLMKTEPVKWQPDEKFDIVLVERPSEVGLTRQEVITVYDNLNANEAYPIEISAEYQEYFAIGFITKKAASVLGFDYKKSGLVTFIATLLDDIRKEEISATYTFKDLSIKLIRKT